jgi:hypothetical protein
MVDPPLRLADQRSLLVDSRKWNLGPERAAVTSPFSRDQPRRVREIWNCNFFNSDMFDFRRSRPVCRSNREMYRCIDFALSQEETDLADAMIECRQLRTSRIRFSPPQLRR